MNANLGVSPTGSMILRPAFKEAIDRALGRARATDAVQDIEALDAAREKFRWDRDLPYLSDDDIDYLMELEKLTQQCRGKDPRYSN
jgi:hypothetical protein